MDFYNVSIYEYGQITYIIILSGIKVYFTIMVDVVTLFGIDGLLWILMVFLNMSIVRSRLSSLYLV